VQASSPTPAMAIDLAIQDKSTTKRSVRASLEKDIKELWERDGGEGYLRETKIAGGFRARESRDRRRVSS
jgi:hypothetical protein